MLRIKLTPAEFEALPEADKAHYSKGSDGKGGEVYHLQTEENTSLKRSLNTERTEKERAEKMLRSLVPELTADNRSEWEDLVTTAAEHAQALKAAGVDLDEWNALKADKDADPKGKGKGAEAAEQLLEAQKRIRELERERATMERDKGKAEAKALKLAAENDTLAKERAIDKALDAAKITDPEDREVVTALLERKGIVVREVGSGADAKREAFIKIDGVEVPVDEHARDFVTTDLGKRFVKAADSSGAGDGPNPTPKPPTKEEFKAMDPLQQLGAALETSASGQAASARR